MRTLNIDSGWFFKRGLYNAFDPMADARPVNLPHDYMIESDVKPDAPAGPSSGFYTEGVCHYNKMVFIPAEWEGELISLDFDGVMMNATVDINGSKAALQHYGYSPFSVDITDKVFFGRENRVTITVNPSMQPNSRWYSGAGIIRSVGLTHTPRLCIANSGIYAYTAGIERDAAGKAESAYIEAEVEVVNRTYDNAVALVELTMVDAAGKTAAVGKQTVQVNANTVQTVYIHFIVDEPLLWSAEAPNLYALKAKVTNKGKFVTHAVKAEGGSVDETAVRFGIRTVTADSRHGLRINGETVKLKGGCLHHDNGIIGAVSMYDTEERKVRILKEVGFNAIRTTHNPPSAALIEACDRLGMYVFDEAFDAWGIMKQPGDYNMFFESDWQKDLTAFIKRDRTSPAVVIWSTGNEIPERGGLGNGYELATKLAQAVRSLDRSRPVSNAICSYWCGLDDDMTKEQQAKQKATADSVQNVDFSKADTVWEENSELFCNGLDIVGYNYLEDKYPLDHVMYPDRVIMGSENFPKEIGKRWPMVEANDYVIGDFTWTAWDYIGEAGIGKTAFVEKDDPRVGKGSWALLSHVTPYPYRLADDADVDINGTILPQGNYRSVVWGSEKTYLFSYAPETFDKVELLTAWAFTSCTKTLNYAGSEGKPIKYVVFSGADEVELIVNGVSAGKKKQGEARAVEDLPLSFVFESIYQPGEVTAISYKDGKEVSRDSLKTTGETASIALTSDKTELPAGGQNLSYVEVSLLDAEGRTVTHSDIKLTASLEGDAELIGFGSARPITEENYQKGEFTSYRSKALAVIRSGKTAGKCVLTVSGNGMTASAAIEVK